MVSEDAGDRDRGILTKRERRYLTGESDIEEGSADERAIRASIRSHLENTFLDFELIDSGLERRDRTAIIEDLDMGMAIQPLIAMVAFVYECSEALGLRTEKILREGIQRGAEHRGGTNASVDLSLTVHKDLDDLLNRFEANDPTLTLQEVRRLLDAGEITREEARDFHEEAFREPNFFGPLDDIDGVDEE